MFGDACQRHGTVEQSTSDFVSEFEWLRLFLWLFQSFEVLWIGGFEMDQRGNLICVPAVLSIWSMTLVTILIAVLLERRLRVCRDQWAKWCLWELYWSSVNVFRVMHIIRWYGWYAVICDVSWCSRKVNFFFIHYLHAEIRINQCIKYLILCVCLNEWNISSLWICRIHSSVLVFQLAVMCWLMTRIIR